MVRCLLELLLGGQVTRPLGALHQPPPHPGPQVAPDVLLAAVDVAAVNEGGDRVDLLPPRLTASWPGPGEVNAGHARVLPHRERWVRLRDIDVEALRPPGVQTAPLLWKAGGADVVIEELTELHHHGAHPLVGVIPLREGPGHDPHIGQVIAWARAPGSKVLRIAR